MATYVPDRWIVITLSDGDEEIDKVLGGWYGGYLGSDTWQVNSGIKSVKEHPDHFIFHGYSGSVYKCFKHDYGLTSLTYSVLSQLKNKIGDKLLCVNKYEQQLEDDLDDD